MIDGSEFGANRDANCDCDKHVTAKCVCGGKCICHTIGIYFDTKPSEGFIYRKNMDNNVKLMNQDTIKNCGTCLFTQGSYFDGTCDNIPGVPGAAEISEDFVCANWEKRKTLKDNVVSYLLFNQLADLDPIPTSLRKSAGVIAEELIRLCGADPNKEA